MSDLRPDDRGPNLWVGVDVEIAADVHLGANVVVHSGVRIGRGSHIEDGAVLGKLTRPGRDSISPSPAIAPTVLGEGTVVGSHAVVCTNVTTGQDVFIGDHALVRESTVLGARVSIGHATTIGRDCRLDDGVRTQSYCVLGVGVVIEEEAFLGPSVVVLSGLMLREGETYEARPAILRRGCHIGSGAQVLPGIEVGAQAVVGAGSVVTRDVPPGARVKGNPARYVTDKPDVPLGEVERFLVSRHGRPIESLAPLAGGFWSAAYSYRVAGQDLVLRLGTVPEGFEADRAAMTFSSPELPVPKVVAIGHALGVGYAISERHYGRFLEDVRAEESRRSGPMLGSLLQALRAIEERPDLSVSGQPADLAPQDSWRNHLLKQLADDGTSRNAGWRAALRQDPELERLFLACEARITDLLDACGEGRHVVHGDLLYQNVLVSEDASTVTGVFSWKRSVRGDFLYDTAHCTFFSPWYPGVGVADPWAVTLSTLTPEQRLDAGARHHCYELTIGASHLGGYLWTNDEQNLRAAQRRLTEILERGEIPAARQ